MTWDRTLLLNLVVFFVLPLLSVLSAGFPNVRLFVGMLMTPLRAGLGAM